MSGNTVVTHKDLDVWKKSLDLAAHIYSLTSRFPKEELYGLTSQMRRAAVSIPSNISEGAARHSRKEFVQFLHVASGSVAELETQLVLASRMGLLPPNTSMAQVEEIRKMLLGLLRSLKKKSITHHSSPITPLL